MLSYGRKEASVRNPRAVQVWRAIDRPPIDTAWHPHVNRARSRLRLEVWLPGCIGKSASDIRTTLGDVSRAV
jgi:hypothetical protein